MNEVTELSTLYGLLCGQTGRSDGITYNSTESGWSRVCSQVAAGVKYGGGFIQGDIARFLTRKALIIIL